MYILSHCYKISGLGVIALSWGSNSLYYCITHPGATLLRLQGGDIQFYTPFVSSTVLSVVPVGLCAYVATEMYKLGFMCIHQLSVTVRSM